MKQNAQTNQTKPTKKSNETQTNRRPNAHTRHNRERDRKRKRECEREREKEVLTYDGWQRGSRRWRWQSVLGVVVASMRGGGGVDERQGWRRGVESEGLFESPEKRVIDQSFSWEWGFFCCWEWASVVFDVCVFLCFFIYLFILNLELRFIKCSSVWIEAAFY